MGHFLSEVDREKEPVGGSRSVKHQGGVVSRDTVVGGGGVPRLCRYRLQRSLVEYFSGVLPTTNLSVTRMRPKGSDERRSGRMTRGREGRQKESVMDGRQGVRPVTEVTG